MMDALIIGGGPAGSKVARLLADRNVTVIEEHAVSGEPMQCTGLISDDVIKLSGVRADEWSSLYGANVHFPNGNVVTARSKERKAILIDRAKLDADMAATAQDSGVTYQYGTKYLGHSISNSNVNVRTSSGDIDSRMIVGADGYRSSVSFSIEGNNAREYVRGFQADIRKRSDDREMIDIYVGNDYAPGFFAWVIPFEDNVRVGLCSTMDSRPPVEYFKNIIRRAGLSDCEIIDKHSGMIPLGGRRTTYADNLMLIGDAAGQVKPISGGGLYPAFKSAYALKETVDEAFSKNDVSANVLKGYERRWKEAVGKELKDGYRLRKIFRKMDDRDLDDVSNVLLKDGVSNILDGLAIDNPSAVAPKLMRNPKFLFGVARPVLRAMTRF